MLNDESYAQKKKAMRKKDISNIHSRLTKRQKLKPPSPQNKDGKKNKGKSDDSNKTENEDSQYDF